MDAAPQFWIRVLLLDDVNCCELNSSSVLAVSIADTDAPLARLQADIPVSVHINAGQITLAGYTSSTEPLLIRPRKPYIFNIDGNDYRGNLMLIPNTDGLTFDAVNLVPIEPYLAGVVGAEMPQYWELGALKAQAIACRTYCLYIKRRFGIGRHWDVRKTQANQLYHGLRAESPRIWTAVNKTFGQVLVCGENPHNQHIFPAYYGCACGGHTESSKNVFGDSFACLAAVSCPYCRQAAKPGRFFWPVVKLDKEALTEKLIENYPRLKELGTITDLIAAKQSDYGTFSRLVRIRLVGSTGKTAVLGAEDFRLTADPTGRKLRSTACRIVDMGREFAFVAGRGYGHGVGMCQCGAQQMAREGKTTKQILSYYYPTARTIRLY